MVLLRHRPGPQHHHVTPLQHHAEKLSSCFPTPSSTKIELSGVVRCPCRKHWESTYGRGTNYILNVPPSPNGEIEPGLVAASAAFRQERERRYGDGKELGAANGTVAAGGTLTLTLPKPSRVDRVWLAETAIATDGQLVSSYKLEAQVGGSWQVRARVELRLCPR